MKNSFKYNINSLQRKNDPHSCQRDLKGNHNWEINMISTTLQTMKYCLIVGFNIVVSCFLFCDFGQWCFGTVVRSLEEELPVFT